MPARDPARRAQRALGASTPQVRQRVKLGVELVDLLVDVAQQPTGLLQILLGTLLLQFVVP